MRSFVANAVFVFERVTHAFRWRGAKSELSWSGLFEILDIDTIKICLQSRRAGKSTATDREQGFLGSSTVIHDLNRRHGPLPENPLLSFSRPAGIADSLILFPESKTLRIMIRKVSIRANFLEPSWVTDAACPRYVDATVILFSA